MGLRKALLVPTLVVILATLLYEPVPSYVQDHYRVAMQTAAEKIIRYLASVASLTGLWDAPHIGLCRAAVKLLGPGVPGNSSQLTVMSGYFARSRTLVFRPAGARPDGPGLVWIHGGGWVTSGPEDYAGFAAKFAIGTNVTVISIGYRLAPEHPFPAALDDCLDAVRAILAHGARDLGVNPHRVMLGGDSAGGQLAAAVAQQLATPGEPLSPRMQLLVYPITQLANFRTKSYLDSGKTPLLEARHVAESASMYLTGSVAHWTSVLTNGHAAKSVKSVYAKYIGESMDHSGPVDVALAASLERRLVDPRVSPLLSPQLDHLRLPPAYIVACQHDPLRSDAQMYAQRLERAGVRVYYKHYPDCYHGCLTGDRDSRGIVDDMIMFFNSNALL